MSPSREVGTDTRTARDIDPNRKTAETARVLPLVLTEEELVALVQILADDDSQEALHFLRRHTHGKLLRLLEGG